MKKNKIKKKHFTLIELIIVIIVIVILGGMALPKFMGTKRDADVASLYQDIDTLDKVVRLYDSNNDTYPLVTDNSGNPSKITPSIDLSNAISKLNDDGSQLYEIDLSKIKSDYTTLKHGNKINGSDDCFVYSLSNNDIYYEKGLEDGKGNVVYYQNSSVGVNTTIDSSWTKINMTNAGTYINETINNYLTQGITKIYIENGTYNLDGPIQITNPNVEIRGESSKDVKLIQTTNADSIVVRSSNVTVSNITIDNRTNSVTGCPFVTANADNVTLDSSIIYGSSNNFAIYFAGKDYPSGTTPVNGFENNDMDSGNKLTNNTIYSTFNGDGVSFAVQNNGLVENNTIIGSRIAFYVCKNSQLLNNTIKDSITNGISVSVPSENNTISGNTITNSKASGIKVAAEVEYPIPDTYVGNNLTITNNIVNNSHYMGVEIDQLSSSTISNNTITNQDNVGIYLLRSDTLNINGNNISNPGYSTVDGNVWGWNQNLDSGIFLDYRNNNIVIDSNQITTSTTNSNYWCNIGVKIANGSLNSTNTITNNTISSKFVAPLDFSTNDNTVSNNTIQ